MSESATDHKHTLDMWAMITIREWLKKIHELNIDRTGHLTSSFVATVVTSAGGDLEKVVFAFDYYGKMVDWGVGKGVPLDLREGFIAAGLTTRRRREWYKQFFHEMAVLKHLYTEKMEAQASNMIINSFSDKA
jgi:hypothetical protein